MREKRTLLMGLWTCVLVGTVILMSPAVQAKYNPLMQVEVQKVRPLVSIVIDKSGSMRWDFGGDMYDELDECKDKDDLASRINVVRNLLVDTPDLFDANDSCSVQEPMKMVDSMAKSMNLGLVWFSKRSWIEVNVSTNDDMTIQDQKRKAIVTSIKEIKPGGGTNIGSGVENAIKDLENASKNDSKKKCGRKRFIILLTDGANNNPKKQRACHLRDNDDDDVYDFDPNLKGDDDCGKKDCYLTQKSKNDKRVNDNSGCLMYQQAETAFKDKNIRVFPVAISEIAKNSLVMYTMNRVACYGGIDASMKNAGLDLTYSEFMSQHDNCDHWYLVYRTRCGVNPNDTFACNKVNNMGHLAFAAETPQRFKQVMETIAALLAVGDFSSSRPTATFSSTGGNIAIFASAELPGWKGHLYRYDQDIDDEDGDGDTKEFKDDPTWDAGEQMCKLGNLTACSNVDIEARNIYIDKNDAQHTLIRIPTDKQLDLNDARVKAIKDIAKAICSNPAWWDGTTDGCPNVLRAIDFLLGGEGTCTAAGSRYNMGHKNRPWMLGPIVGSQPIILGKPLTYTLGTAPTKTSFDALYAGRKELVLVGSDDGMLHAFDFETGKERWAFLPGPLICQVPRRLRAYNPNLNPTGQAGTTDSHIFGINTTPVYADVTDENETDTTKYPSKWKSLVFFGLAGGAGGAYALDVTCAHPDDSTTCAKFLTGWPDTPPFKVQWYLPPGTYSNREINKVWQFIPVGLTNEGSTGLKETWAVALTSGYDLSDLDDLGLFVFEAHSGNLLKTFNASSYYTNNPKLDVDEEGFLAGPTLMETDKDVYYHDSVVTHVLAGDLSGRIHVLNISDVSANNWKYNFPATFDLVGGDRTQAFHHDLAVAHLNKSFNYMVAFNTGSVFEDDPYYKGSEFKPKLGASLFYLDASKNFRLSQDANKSVVFTVPDEVQVCIDYDATSGQCKQQQKPSNLSRFTSQPLVVVDSGSTRKSGTIINLLFDPEYVTQVQTDDGPMDICGATFRVRLPFTVNPNGSNGDQTAFLSSTQIQSAKNVQVGAGVVSGIGRTISGAFVIQSGIGKGSKAKPQPIEEEWSQESSVIVRFKVMF